ncbi:MAG: hypothetical protein ABMB14_22880, partial [Myxococcota bacterium]
LDLVARWTVVAPRPTGTALALAGPEVTVDEVRVNGVPTGTERGDDGGTVLQLLVTGETAIEVRGSVAGDPATGLSVRLLPAGSGVIDHPEALVATGAVAIGPGRSVGAPASVTFAPAPARGGDGTLILGEVGLGVTVGEADVAVRGRLRWRIARGSIERVSATIPGAGADLTVTGPTVASWTRSGDTVDVVLRAPERGLVALDVGYSLPAPTGEVGAVPIPAITLSDTFRTTATLQLARDGQLDVVPAIASATPVAPDDLPPWARDLVVGAPTASLIGGGGSLAVYHFTPADSPPADSLPADRSPAISAPAGSGAAPVDAGRVRRRAHYAVRNDRGATLGVIPPPGFRPIGVRVGGEPAELARDGDTWLVPLEKSVETVEGLLSFPVEVILLGESLPGQDGRWARRERRTLAMPTVDAEIAVARATVHLPPGYSRRGPRGGDAVDAFSEGQGITYGFAVGDVRAAQADQLFQQAVDAWMGNAFDETGAILDQLEQMGADNEDIGRLKANLEVLDAKEPDAGASQTQDAVERRVLEQARARSTEDERKQQEEVERADRAYAEGDYREAEEAYKNALDLGEDLAKLRSKEDVAQEYENRAVQEKLAKSQVVSAQKSKSSSDQSNAAFGGGSTVDNQYVVDGTTTTERSEIVVEDREELEAEVDQPFHGAFGPTTPAELPPADVADKNGAEHTVDAPVVTAAPVESVDSVETSEQVEIIGGNRRISVRLPEMKKEAPPPPVSVTSPTRPSPLPNPAPPAQVAHATPAPPVVDADSTSTGTVLTKEYLQRIPVGRTYQSAVATLPGVSGKRGEAYDGEKDRASAGSGGEPNLAGAAAAPEPLAVTASVLAVVVPSIGEPVLFQHLLLPPGSRWDLPIDAKTVRRDR